MPGDPRMRVVWADAGARARRHPNARRRWPSGLASRRRAIPAPLGMTVVKGQRTDKEPMNYGRRPAEFGARYVER